MEWPPDGSQLPGYPAAGGLALLVLAAYALFEAAEKVNRRDRRLTSMLCLAAAAILGLIAVCLGFRWLNALGIDPTRHAYGAAVWTLLGYLGGHLALGAGMALWCLARLALGMLNAWRSLTLRICLLWWRFTAPASVLALLLVAGFPRVV